MTSHRIIHEQRFNTMNEKPQISQITQIFPFYLRNLCNLRLIFRGEINESNRG
jgi:hypothetical protein